MRSSSFRPFLPVMAGFAVLILAACNPGDSPATAGSAAADTDTPTALEAAEFVRQAEARLESLSQHADRQHWVLSTYITEDTERLAAKASEALTAAQVEVAGDAARFSKLSGLDEITRRKLNILRSGISMPAPADPAKNAEQADIGARLASMYGKGRYCTREGACKDLGELEAVIESSRDPDQLLQAWSGWREVSPAMKPLYERQVQLANEGAEELGFSDLGAMWRSGYDMPADEFPGELDRLWGQVSPLYEALHCHVRARLGQQYGTGLVPEDGLIPAHLLGNMWAQTWGNIYPLVAPDDTGADFDLTSILQERGFDAVGLVRVGEAFFSSLGFDPLPDTFWERSQFVQPRDRDVVCHASAWNVDEKNDLRIKMCIDVQEEDFGVIHHELGHNYYQRAYNQESFVYRGSANDGFHEAVGDAVALSITPEYLAKIGLLDSIPDASSDIGLLLKLALEKIAFLPFGLMVDQWRWKVFAGEVGAEEYNDLWWALRARYQGISAPNERPPDAFDPGAKYHVPGNVSYTRYFLAAILQFQFHRALCDIAGDEGPVHRCSIYDSEPAGRRLEAMLTMGKSQPWPNALEALSGEREMDATAILDYFDPLKTWLDEQNANRQCGW